jgi:hypothetical protein
MSSPEQILQQKIDNLERQFVEIFDNVHNSKKIPKKHTEDMRQSSRNKKEDGIYLRTIDFGGVTGETHGIFINKVTQPDNSVIFYIYEPNGKKDFNNRYELNIASNQNFVVDLSMSPDKSINDHGHCAVWCIIVVILWNTFPSKDRFTALNLFNNQMRSSYEIRKSFINDILRLLRSGNNFDTQSEVTAFVQEVSRRIQSVNVAPVMPKKI